LLKKPQPELKSEKSKVKSAESGGVCSNFFLCTFAFSLQAAFFSSLLDVAVAGANSRLIVEDMWLALCRC
jgi:hypothetical protein